MKWQRLVVILLLGCAPPPPGEDHSTFTSKPPIAPLADGTRVTLFWPFQNKCNVAIDVDLWIQNGDTAFGSIPPDKLQYLEISCRTSIDEVCFDAVGANRSWGNVEPNNGPAWCQPCKPGWVPQQVFTCD